jgi:hypothetical protein
MSQASTSLHQDDDRPGEKNPEDVASVFIPSAESRGRTSHRLRWLIVSLASLLAIAAIAVMVAWPRLRSIRLDSVERVADRYLQALVREDSETIRRLGTLEDPPAIRSVKSVAHDRSLDRVLRGSFAPLGDFHTRLDAEYAYDAGSSRYTPKNPLGAAAETLDALHAAKEEAEKSNLADKIKSGSPDDLFDAAEQLAKSLASLSTGALAPARILPSYRMLVESAKPPLAEDAKSLALEVAESPKTWEALLKRPFQTLRADGPFVYDRAEVTATVADRLASLGDPPSRLRLSLARFRLEGIDTGWKVVAARRVRPGEVDQDRPRAGSNPYPVSPSRPSTSASASTPSQDEGDSR